MKTDVIKFDGNHLSVRFELNCTTFSLHPPLSFSFLTPVEQIPMPSAAVKSKMAAIIFIKKKIEHLLAKITPVLKAYTILPLSAEIKLFNPI